MEKHAGYSIRISRWDAKGGELTSQRLEYTCFTYPFYNRFPIPYTHQLYEYLLYKLPLFFTPL